MTTSRPLVSLLLALACVAASPSPAKLANRRLQEVESSSASTTPVPFIAASAAQGHDSAAQFPLPVAVILGIVAIAGVVTLVVYVYKTARRDAMRKTVTEPSAVLHMDGFIVM